MKVGYEIMGLEERENKRKQSIVKSAISDSPEGADTQNDVSQTINIVSKIKTETRSKRVNLLITPSTYTAAQKKCEHMGISLNECINQFLYS